VLRIQPQLYRGITKWVLYLYDFCVKVLVYMYNHYKEVQTLMVNNYNNINKMSNHLSSQAIEHKTDHTILLFVCFFTPLLVLKITQFCRINISSIWYLQTKMSTFSLYCSISGLVVSTDANYNSAEIPANSNSQNRLPETIANEADFLKSYTTVPGYVSFRCPINGTLYIRSLFGNLTKYAQR